MAWRCCQRLVQSSAGKLSHVVPVPLSTRTQWRGFSQLHTPTWATASGRRPVLSSWRRDFVHVSEVRLAPAKKKAKGKAAPAGAAAATGPAGADQIFNIYAGRPDEEIKSDEHYPAWLWDLEHPPKMYGELALMFVHGVGIEDAKLSDYQRFLRQHRKLVIKINNLRLKKSRRRVGLRIT
uniref:Mitochondrial ribosomal protein L37 n=1 Tax=Noctiluca scintillans TaxID=2966 RepID=A0A7S1AS63_NOCSC|mmetsp:Transcript_57705/g.153814  ORF Transcript_57705/g.153814 Transcript_57705/m.153814 type:complete len:180 (+) Transcript_57705:29-568(+)